MNLQSRTYRSSQSLGMGDALGYVLDDMSFINGIIDWDSNASLADREIRWGRASEPPVAVVQVKRGRSTEEVTVYGMPEAIERFGELVRAKEGQLATKVAPPSS